MNRLSALVVGAGSIGLRRARILISSGFSVDLCDSSPDQRAQAQRLSGRGNIYSDLEEAVAESGAVVCLVCTPPSSHLKIAMAAAEAGMDLFIEKPLSNTFDPYQLNHLAETCRNHSVKVRMGFSYRSLPSLLRFRKEMPSSMISANFWSGQNLDDWGAVIGKNYGYHVSPEDGGIVRDSLTHIVDQIHWLFGDIQAVYSHLTCTGTFALGICDSADVMFELENGSVVTAHADYLQIPRESRLTVLTSVLAGVNCMTWTFNPAEAGLMYLAETYSLEHSIKMDVQSQPDLAEGIYNMEVLDAIVRSNEAKQRVEVGEIWRSIWRGYYVQR